MKTFTIFVTSIPTLFLLSACKKNYNCRCDGGALGGGKTIVIENKTKQQAEEACEGYNSNSVFSYHNCHLQ